MMLETYYSKNVNSKEIFDKLNISKCNSYEKHLNKHNVIYITFNNNASSCKTYDEYMNYYISRLSSDIKELWPDIEIKKEIPDILEQIYYKTGEGFIFIIDEWDYIYNNNLFTEQDREKFLLFLKNLLKDKPYVELCYMTGVLPIAKYCIGSALNMFQEFTFLNDNIYHTYYGFTTEEVENLCSKQDKITMKNLKEWYNGYKIQGIDLYNPRSVVSALTRGICQSYWTNTGPVEEIAYLLRYNVDSVKNDVIKMLSGEKVFIMLDDYDTEKLKLNTREDILLAMAVYGLLTYYDGVLEIPNKEIKMKFVKSLRKQEMKEISKFLLRSYDLLQATINKNIDTMVEIIQNTHEEFTSIIKYHDENSLSCILTIAYISAIDNYRIVREMPTGKGFADFIFYSRSVNYPSFVVELKRDVSVQEALDQIFEKHYDQSLKDYPGEKLAIGISYDSKNKKHDILLKTFL